MNSVDDHKFTEWTRRLNASDEDALDELFQAAFEPLVKYAWRYTADKPTAMDIVQDCFVKLWEVRHRLNPDKSLRSYLYNMVKNRSLNYLRDSHTDTVQLDDMQLADPEQETDTIEIESGQAEELSDRFEMWIEDLPDRQREAFELSRFDGLTHDEIAEIMDISARTVNNHIVSALNTLKEKYQDFATYN